MKFHPVDRISFSGNEMLVEVDGRRIVVNLSKISPLLAAASTEQRLRYEISPSGYGIHWPDLDEDMSVDALLDIKHAPKTKFAESMAEDCPPAD